MCKQMTSVACKATLALLALLMLTNEASAYAGPMPGPEVMGYFMSLIAWMGVAFSSLLLWPLHALRQRFRKAAPAVHESQALAIISSDSDKAAS